jgi:hypothetical protein
MSNQTNKTMRLEQLLNGQDLSVDKTLEAYLNDGTYNGGPITQIIIEAWVNGGGGKTAWPDLEQIEQDLSYAINQLERARKNVRELSK